MTTIQAAIDALATLITEDLERLTEGHDPETVRVYRARIEQCDRACRALSALEPVLGTTIDACETVAENHAWSAGGGTDDEEWRQKRLTECETAATALSALMEDC